MAIPPASRQRYDIVVRGRLSARYDFAFDGVTLEPRHGETMHLLFSILRNHA